MMGVLCCRGCPSTTTGGPATPASPRRTRRRIARPSFHVRFRQRQQQPQHAFHLFTPTILIILHLEQHLDILISIYPKTLSICLSPGLEQDRTIERCNWSKYMSVYQQCRHLTSLPKTAVCQKHKNRGAYIGKIVVESD